MCTNVILSGAFCLYLLDNPITWTDFLFGSIVGILFAIGQVSSVFAYETGAGGPINALICTQVLYQTTINAIWFGQGLGSFEIAGIACGIMATLIICLGDEVIKKCKGPSEAKN